MKMTEAEYLKECETILNEIGETERNRIFSYDYCELDASFLGFLDNYKDVAEQVPKDFTIIDMGCCMAVQAHYFKNHACYIGVEPDTDVNHCLHQPNAVYYKQTAQQFIEDMKTGQKQNFDLNKTFVICSAVPDESARKLISETFPYCRIVYPGMEPVERFPDTENSEDLPIPDAKHLAVKLSRETPDTPDDNKDPQSTKGVPTI